MRGDGEGARIGCEKSSDGHAGLTQVKDRKRTGGLDGRVKLQFSSMEVWQGLWQVLEPKSPIREVPHLPGMGLPSVPAVLSLVGS